MISDIDGLKKLCRPSSDDETKQLFVNETDLTDYGLTHLTRLLLDVNESSPYQAPVFLEDCSPRSKSKPELCGSPIMQFIREALKHTAADQSAQAFRAS